MLRRSAAKAIHHADLLTWAEATVLATATLGTATALVAIAYLAKSAAGVDLMAGHSPLHDILYPLIAR
jgi:methylthioribose-1-phosphate isomerase